MERSHQENHEEETEFDGHNWKGTGSQVEGYRGVYGEEILIDLICWHVLLNIIKIAAVKRPSRVFVQNCNELVLLHA